MSHGLAPPGPEPSRTTTGRRVPERRPGVVPTAAAAEGAQGRRDRAGAGSARTGTWVRPMVALSTLAALAVALWLSGLRDRIDVAALRQAIDAAGMGAPALYVVFTVLGIAVGIPGMIFVLAGIVGFAGLPGAGLALLSGTLGCVTAVAWIQRVGGAPLRDSPPPRLRRVLARLDRRPVLGVALLRMLFLMSAPGNAALAFAGVRAWDNARGTLLGLLPAITMATLTTEWLLGLLHMAP